MPTGGARVLAPEGDAACGAPSPRIMTAFPRDVEPRTVRSGALPGLRTSWTAYYEALRDLGGRLMSLFARGLGLPPGVFADATSHGANALRAINYPARRGAARPGQLRAGAHTDYGTVTILRSL